MTFRQKIIFESALKYVLIFIIAFLSWNPISQGLQAAADSGKLESIAIIMSIVSLSSITGYFAFSYTTVGKHFNERIFGYAATFFLGLSLLLSLIINYNIAAIWVPEMQMIWLLILGSLYIGTILFDNLDLLRLGMDVAATTFFEKAHNFGSAGSDKISATVSFLKEGQRLPYANGLIGQALLELGKTKENNGFIEVGEWILDNTEASQKEVDKKVAEAFSDYGKKDKKIEEFVSSLNKGETQYIADNLIANLIERVKEKSE